MIVGVNGLADGGSREANVIALLAVIELEGKLGGCMASLA